jgi:hypothetical protein
VGDRRAFLFPFFQPSFLPKNSVLFFFRRKKKGQLSHYNKPKVYDDVNGKKKVGVPPPALREVLLTSPTFYRWGKEGGLLPSSPQPQPPALREAREGEREAGLSFGRPEISSLQSKTSGF